MFEGCLVVVSHDNFFVNRVAEHLFIFQGDGVVRDFQGTYSEYLECRQDLNQQFQAQQSRQVPDKKTSESKAQVQELSPGKAASNAGSGGGKNNQKKELVKLEKEIAKLEAQIKALEEKINSAEASVGYSVLNDWTQEMSNLALILQEKEERWLELSEDT